MAKNIAIFIYSTNKYRKRKTMKYIFFSAIFLNLSCHYPHTARPDPSIRHYVALRASGGKKNCCLLYLPLILSFFASKKYRRIRDERWEKKLLTAMKLSLKILFISLIHLTCHSLQKAVINVPIADLLGSPITTVRPDENIDIAYNNIPLCSAQTNSSFTCPRLHQLLYNDIVELIKINNDEAFIRTTHAFYMTPSSPTPQTDYWTLKKNITLLDDITNNIPLDHIPEPIAFTNKNNMTSNNINTATLQEPYYCATLKTNFSVGTRFLCTPLTKKKQNSSITVYAIDYKTMQEHHISIPRKKCILTNQTKTNNERITDYVNLLKQWTCTKNGCIPYVWGGTSFTHPTQGSFKEVTQTTNNSDYTFYQYNKNENTPKNGFDCSGVILRATQICGLPYFCKNTTTIAQCLKPLNKEQQLIDGDLILVKGHVMAVSDIKNNLLIEARSYSHGYGKLHEIPINEVFEGIETYKDLCNAYFDKRIIKRKDKQGKIRDTFTNLQLLSIASVWDEKP